MKKNLFTILSVFLTLALFSGCDIIGGIFKAGVWVGVLLVVLLIALILYVINKSKKNKK